MKVGGFGREVIRIGFVVAAVVVCSSFVGASVVGASVVGASFVGTSVVGASFVGASVVIVVLCRSEVARVFAEALAFRVCLRICFRLLCLAVTALGVLE